MARCFSKPRLMCRPWQQNVSICREIDISDTYISASIKIKRKAERLHSSHINTAFFPFSQIIARLSPPKSSESFLLLFFSPCVFLSTCWWWSVYVWKCCCVVSYGSHVVWQKAGTQSSWWADVWPQRPHAAAGQRSALPPWRLSSS